MLLELIKAVSFSSALFWPPHPWQCHTRKGTSACWLTPKFCTAIPSAWKFPQPDLTSCQKPFPNLASQILHSIPGLCHHPGSNSPPLITKTLSYYRIYAWLPCDKCSITFVKSMGGTQHHLLKPRRPRAGSRQWGPSNHHQCVFSFRSSHCPFPGLVLLGSTRLAFLRPLVLVPPSYHPFLRGP